MAALFRPHESAFQSQYSEVRERARAAGRLLPGTPGALKQRSGTGYSYWYRVYYLPPGTQREEFVGKEGDVAAIEAAQERIAFSGWVAEQVPTLRRIGFQVADKNTARVLVELHDAGAFHAGLVLVGSLAYMAWLNELGAIAASSRTMDVDVARGDRLALEKRDSLLQTANDLRLKFPTLPELRWPAQAMPFYDYLLADPADAAVLAGWQCIPVRIPQAARMVWHKLYTSVKRTDASTHAKDFQQATILAAVLTDSEPQALPLAMQSAPAGLLSPIRGLRPRLKAELASHPQAAAFFEAALSG